ncbi:12308_t:CDS:2 [Gigaspora rosea]|nr:12308_t:CDS:2 [Gigaspora rosea]
MAKSTKLINLMANGRENTPTKSPPERTLKSTCDYFNVLNKKTDKKEYAFLALCFAKSILNTALNDIVYISQAR